MPESTDISREDIVVAIAAGADGRFPLDAIRLMKACFLVAMRGRPEWRPHFSFEPYDYGPFDRGVYQARDALLARELLTADTAARYASYELTPEGQAHAAVLRGRIGDKAADWLAQTGAYVTSKSFSQLLDDVYTAFPEYATNSIARL